MTGSHFQTLGLPVNQSASPLGGVEEGQSMHFIIGLWCLIRKETGLSDFPPPLAKGGKGEVRVLGCHHRTGKKGKGQCSRSSGQLAPGDEATLMLQRFGPDM